MISGLGKKFKLGTETTSKPNQEYCTEEYGKLGLPKAPVIMIGDEVIVQGRDMDEEQLEPYSIDSMHKLT